jgi:hypothetical protein
MDEEVTLTLRMFNYTELTHALAYTLLAAAFARAWLAGRLVSAGLAALGFGLSALLSLWIFARGYWAPSVVHIGDLAAEISSTEWYARMAVRLLFELPLLVGAVAALFNLRHQGAMAARRPGPPH